MEEILHQLVKIFHYVEGFIHPRMCRISSIHVVPTTKFPLQATNRGCEVITGKNVERQSGSAGCPKGWLLEIQSNELCNGTDSSTRVTALCRWRFALVLWHPKDPLMAAQCSCKPVSWIQDSRGASGKRTTWVRTEHWHSLVAKASEDPLSLQRWWQKQCTWIFANCDIRHAPAVCGVCWSGFNMQDFPSHVIFLQ